MTTLRANTEPKIHRETATALEAGLAAFAKANAAAAKADAAAELTDKVAGAPRPPSGG